MYQRLDHNIIGKMWSKGYHIFLKIKEKKFMYSKIIDCKVLQHFSILLVTDTCMWFFHSLFLKSFYYLGCTQT